MASHNALYRTDAEKLYQKILALIFYMHFNQFNSINYPIQCKYYNNKYPGNNTDTIDTNSNDFKKCISVPCHLCSTFHIPAACID